MVALFWSKHHLVVSNLTKFEKNYTATPISEQQQQQQLLFNPYT